MGQGGGMMNTMTPQTLVGTVISVDDLTVTLDTATLGQVTLPLQHGHTAPANPIAFAPGDAVTAEVMLMAGSITNQRSEETLHLRDPNGRPLWAGRGMMMRPDMMVMAQNWPMIPHEWLLLTGTVTVASDASLTVETVAWAEQAFWLGRPGFAANQNITFTAGDAVTVETMLVPVRLTNDTSGDSLDLETGPGHQRGGAGMPPPTVAPTAESEAQPAASPTQAGQAAVAPDEDTIATALSLYATNCAACHGAAGEGNSLGPALNDPVLRDERTAEALTLSITAGVSGTLMVPWADTLSDAEIAALVTLIQHWDAISATAEVADAPAYVASTDPDIIAAGANLYGITCANCHGEQGQGTAIAPAFNTPEYLATTNDPALRLIIAQGVPGTMMPAWGRRLSTDEIHRLVSFMRSWEAE